MEVGPLWPSDRQEHGQIWFIEGLAQQTSESWKWTVAGTRAPLRVILKDSDEGNSSQREEYLFGHPLEWKEK